MPARNTSRKVGGACFQTRVRAPRMSISSISKREPGAVRSARASAMDTAGHGFVWGADRDTELPRSTFFVVERHTRYPSPLAGEVADPSRTRVGGARGVLGNTVGIGT